jgi:PKD repeat protein
MAIGRVKGPSLESTLDRQGVDLQFTTSSEPLLYLDFSKFQAAINTNTLATTETFTVNGSGDIGNVKIINTVLSSAADITLSPAGSLFLGNIAKVKIDGGGMNYLMTTDGGGNLRWQNIGDVSQELNLDGMHISLGVPSDGSLTANAAYRYWTPTTYVTNAIDNLNQVLLNVSQGTFVGAVDFTSNITQGPSPITVAFTASTIGNPDTYYWDFGDGQTSTILNPTHTYNNNLGGQYNVYFKASNSAGTLAGSGANGTGAQGSYADVNKQNYITLYTPAPIPSFTIDKVSINSLGSVQLTNTSQHSESYVIHWGDGSNTPVSSNTDPGGVSGGPISHQYTNISGDFIYSIIVEGYSSTAGPSGLYVSSVPTAVKVYSTHNPTFTTNPTVGNNQHATIPNGLVVSFTNTTTTGPGATSAFATNVLEWDFGDGTTANVNIGTNSPGDLGRTISHPYTLTDPTVGQTFSATLNVFNGHSTSPFASAATLIQVKPAPTSLFTGNVIQISDRIGDTAQTGYAFTDLNGYDRRIVNLYNTSINTDSYSWVFGDGNTATNLTEGLLGTPTGGSLPHTYVNTGTYTVSLLAHGPNSLTVNDDTLTRASYVNILPAPAAPSGLGTKTFTMPSTGTLPLLASNAINNSSLQIPTAGTAVNRITTLNPIATSFVSNVYNAESGTLTTIINGTSESPVVLTGANDVGTYGSLVISEDKDAHAVDPTVYPSNFYKVFSGQITKSNAATNVGYNTYQLSHSGTGNTNVLGFVKDDVTTVPTLDITVATATTVSAGALKYISGVPYFNTGGSIQISGVNAYNWIGQTYLGVTLPMTVLPGTVVEGSGTSVVSQGKSYSQINGASSFLSSGIPIANTGKTSAVAYTLGNIPVVINGTAASSSKVKLQLDNVNGSSTQVELPFLINVYSTALTGFDELNIPVSPTLGGGFIDNGKRILINGATGGTPVYNSSTNYYVNLAFTGAVAVSGTDECIQRFGALTHSSTNFQSYLPAGPDLSGRSGFQYFRFAFRRTAMANFTITYTGKISGLWIAAPGTQIDVTSQIHGWLDATQVYAGAGIPGGNIGVGGNGSDGCAKTSGDVIPVVTPVINGSYVMTLGSANASDATGNNILVSIALASGDSISSISIS